jgi:hypothetical protein
MQQPLVGQDLLIIEASVSHSDILHSVGLLWKSDWPDAETSLPETTQHSQERDIHAHSGIRTRNRGKWATADPHLRSRSKYRAYWFSDKML